MEEKSVTIAPSDKSVCIDKDDSAAKTSGISRRSNNDFVSVIIPVYNSAAYLPECIDSVLAQTYSHYEIILVDDGSTDESCAICDEYASKNACIRVVHQRNRGLSAARNAGLEIALGEYIALVDSDDLIHSYFLERMTDVAHKYGAAWVQCGAQFGTDRRVNGKINQKEQVFSGKHALLHDCIKVRACGVLYHKSVFNGLCFPEMKIYEDEAMYYKLVYNANSAVRINDELYYYFYNKDSLSKKEGNLISDCFIDVYHQRIAYFSDLNDKKMVIKSKERFCRCLMVLYVRCKKNPANQNDTVAYLSTIRKLAKEIVRSGIPSLKSRLQCMIFALFPELSTKVAMRLKLNVRF